MSIGAVGGATRFLVIFLFDFVDKVLHIEVVDRGLLRQVRRRFGAADGSGGSEYFGGFHSFLAGLALSGATLCTVGHLRFYLSERDLGRQGVGNCCEPVSISHAADRDENK